MSDKTRQTLGQIVRDSYFVICTNTTQYPRLKTINITSLNNTK